jgi:glycine cleavage system regulatory protein
MQRSVVVTVLGPDRPGLVSAVSDCAALHRANWADSVMATFAGQFSGIVHLQVEAQHAQALVEALRALGSEALKISTVIADINSPPASRSVSLELVGNDRPGIIHSISGQLARLGVGIEKLQTRISSAPMAGGDMFHMHAQLQIPASLHQDVLQNALESLANELMVDVAIDPRK